MGSHDVKLALVALVDDDGVHCGEGCPLQFNWVCAYPWTRALLGSWTRLEFDGPPAVNERLFRCPACLSAESSPSPQSAPTRCEVPGCLGDQHAEHCEALILRLLPHARPHRNDPLYAQAVKLLGVDRIAEVYGVPEPPLPPEQPAPAEPTPAAPPTLRAGMRVRVSKPGGGRNGWHADEHGILDKQGSGVVWSPADDRWLDGAIAMLEDCFYNGMWQASIPSANLTAVVHPDWLTPVEPQGEGGEG